MQNIYTFIFDQSLKMLMMSRLLRKTIHLYSSFSRHTLFNINLPMSPFIPLHIFLEYVLLKGLQL